MTFDPCDHHIQAEKLARLPPERWADLDMTPVSAKALQQAMKWLSGLVLFPCADGTVQIEGHFLRGDFQIDFDDDGPVVLLGADRWDHVVTLNYSEDEG